MFPTDGGMGCGDTAAVSGSSALDEETEAVEPGGGWCSDMGEYLERES